MCHRCIRVLRLWRLTKEIWKMCSLCGFLHSFSQSMTSQIQCERRYNRWHHHLITRDSGGRAGSCGEGWLGPSLERRVERERGLHDYNRALHCILSLSLSFFSFPLLTCSLSPRSFLSVDDVISLLSQTSSELERRESGGGEAFCFQNRKVEVVEKWAGSRGDTGNQHRVHDKQLSRWGCSDVWGPAVSITVRDSLCWCHCFSTLGWDAAVNSHIVLPGLFKLLARGSSVLWCQPQFLYVRQE